MRTLICTLHRIDDTSGVNRAVFFRGWSELQSAENTIQIVSGRTVSRNLSKSFFSDANNCNRRRLLSWFCFSPPLSIFLLPSSRSLSASSRLASEVSSSNLSASRSDFASSCFCFPHQLSIFNSSGRLCFSHSASRLRLTSRISSLILSTSSSRINTSASPSNHSSGSRSHSPCRPFWA